MRLLSVLLTVMLAQNPSVQPQTGVVTGQLLRSDGTPAAGIRIAVTPVDAKDPTGVAGDLISLAQTDERGNYRLEDIPPGRYYIQAGLLDFPNYYPGATSFDKATSIDVEAGKTMQVDAFRMVRSTGVRISGSIPPGTAAGPQVIFIGEVNANQLRNRALLNLGMGNLSGRMAVGTVVTRSVNGTTMTLRLSGIPFPGSAGASPTIVGPDGTFEIVGLKPGTYTLFALPSNPPMQATVVVQDKDIEIALPTTPGVKVSGLLGVHETSRLPNEKLTLTGPIWGQLETTTDTAGAFEFPNVPAGTYSVRNLEGVELSSIDVDSNDLSGVVVPTLAVISGTAFVEDEGAPNTLLPVLTATRTDGTTIPLSIPRGPLTLFAGGGTETSFKLPLSEGEYRLTVDNVGPLYFVKSMTSGSVDLLKEPLIIAGPAPQDIHVRIGKKPE
jgi:hypothetical protein